MSPPENAKKLACPLLGFTVMSVKTVSSLLLLLALLGTAACGGQSVTGYEATESGSALGPMPVDFDLDDGIVDNLGFLTLKESCMTAIDDTITDGFAGNPNFIVTVDVIIDALNRDGEDVTCLQALDFLQSLYTPERLVNTFNASIARALNAKLESEAWTWMVMQELFYQRILGKS